MKIMTSDGAVKPPGIIDINTDLVERRRKGMVGARAGMNSKYISSVHPFYVIHVPSVTRVYSLKSLLSRSALSRRWTNKSSTLFFRYECTSRQRECPLKFYLTRNISCTYVQHTLTNILPMHLFLILKYYLSRFS